LFITICLELIMKVRIVRRPTGLLNGRDWPEAGEVFEVDDVSGADMCAAGIGEPVVEDGVEKAVAPEGEKRRGRPRRTEDGA
jgi:hypothetical protein